MISALRGLNKSAGLAKQGIRWVTHQIPFDLKDKDKNYDELNNMYTEMFAQDSEATSSQGGSGREEIQQSILDKLNDETSQLLNIRYQTLTAEELERKVKEPGRFVMQSLSKNPFYNLALENYIFNNTSVTRDEDVKFNNQRLLFYINKPCVVIGKNQTVWKEVYLKGIAKGGYDLLRRFSGGGTVVHDLGNVNYSFITSREEFERDFFNKLMVKWIMSVRPDIFLSINPRGDVVYENKKVSGSAFKIAKGKSYHHGTMLINSNLNRFHGLLKPANIEGVTWKCNSVDSVRSEVTNVPLQSTQEFIEICSDGFKNYYSSGDCDNRTISIYYCDEDISFNKEIQDDMSKLKSERWKYLTGPRFSVNFENSNHSITVEKGQITSSTIPEIVGSSFKSFTEKLYKYPSIKKELIF